MRWGKCTEETFGGKSRDPQEGDGWKVAASCWPRADSITGRNQTRPSSDWGDGTGLCQASDRGIGTSAGWAADWEPLPCVGWTTDVETLAGIRRATDTDGAVDWKPLADVGGGARTGVSHQQRKPGRCRVGCRHWSWGSGLAWYWRCRPRQRWGTVEQGARLQGARTGSGILLSCGRHLVGQPGSQERHLGFGRLWGRQKANRLVVSARLRIRAIEVSNQNLRLATSEMKCGAHRTAFN